MGGERTDSRFQRLDTTGEEYSAGVNTVKAVINEFAITADGGWQYVYTVNAPWMQCRFDAAGAGAGNSSLTVHAWLGVL